MKIIFNRQEIINTVSPLLCAVGSKSTIPTVECLLIEAKMPDSITLTTYDLEKGVRCSASGSVLEDGFYAINANKFFQTLKVMEGEEVILTVNDKLETTISSGKSSYKMQAFNGADFPAVPNIREDMSFEIPAALLKKTISKISFAMGVNDQRPVLNGAYFRITDGELLAVSCDSFKMAKCRCLTTLTNKNTDGSALRYSYIVPQKTVNELFRMLPDGDDDVVTVYMSRKNMVYVFEGLTFFTRLIEGEYIDFDRIILKNHKINVTVERARLLAALERAAIVTEEKIAGSTRTPIKLSAEGDMLKLTAVSSVGSSYDEIEVEHTGEDILIAFNNRYLIDAVRACSSDKVKIELSTPLYSINIIPVEEETGEEDEKKVQNDDLFFLLPVRMKN